MDETIDAALERPAATPSPVVLVMTHTPDVDSAEAMGRALLEERLAAAVSIVPGLSSTYRWRGQMTSVVETQVQIKTHVARYPQVERTICALHPYELPSIICVSIRAGLPAYVKWIAESVDMQA